MHNNTSCEGQAFLFLQAVLSGELGKTSRAEDTGTDISHAASRQLLAMPESAEEPAAVGGNGSVSQDIIDCGAAHETGSSTGENGEHCSNREGVSPVEAGAAPANKV